MISNSNKGNNLNSREYNWIENQNYSITPYEIDKIKGENDNSKMPNAVFFGKFTVYPRGTDLPIRWRTTKSEELFAFLLYKGKNKITKQEICDALWPEGCRDLNNNLHTSIYKMKKTLNIHNINIDMKFINGCYYIKLPEIKRDVYVFEGIYNKLHSSQGQISDDEYVAVEKAVLLYNDDYLIENDYSWSFLRREILRDQFIALVKDISFFYFKKKDYMSAKKTILGFINNDNLNETAHELL